MRRFELVAHTFRAPLRFAFRHASATRQETESVIVLARTADDETGAETTGIGECCPRSYVTGETVQSVLSFIAEHRQELEERAGSLEELQGWMVTHRNELDKNPAAFAALEGAIIDYLARQAGQSLEQFLGLPQLKESCRYSAILGDSRPSVFWLQAMIYCLLGFRDYKIKLSGHLERDRAKLAVFGRLPCLKRARLRADANNLWADAQSCIEYVRQLETSFWAIEEPVAAGSWSEQAAIAKALDVKVILDESLLRIAQLEEDEELPGFAIANIRISKNGGILRSLALARAAADKGMPLIFGAHVGESSVLTRAALCVANACDEVTLAREGAYGRILLKHEPVRPSLRFGWRGLLRPKRLLPHGHSGSGLRLIETELRTAI